MHYDPVCGTDGQTYVNECYLQSEACAKRIDIAVFRRGECTDGKRPIGLSLNQSIKLISFYNEIMFKNFPVSNFTDLNLYCIKGALALFVLVSLSGYTCAR